MKRRDFIAMIGGVAAAPALWSRTASAWQQPRRVKYIGVLMAYAESDAEAQNYVAAFRRGLRDLGWKEGANVQIDYRWTMPDMELVRRFAAELVVLEPDLILSSGARTTVALLRETHSIPIIFTAVVDPVGSGFVASLPRPGGNVTGFINLDPRTAGKWLELLKEVAPHISNVAVPFNAEATPYAEVYLTSLKVAATSLGVAAIAAPIRDMAELETFMSARARESNCGLIPIPDGFMDAYRVEITSLAAHYRLPAAYFDRGFPNAGGLLSYGIDNADNWRRAASYGDRILKGEQPSELPVKLPIKFELVLNLKTADALGLTVSPRLLARADEVIA